MKLAGKIVAGLAALMMVAGTAKAADIPMVVAPVAVAPAPAPIAPPAFDWGGAYIGTSGAYLFGYPFVAVQAGYNAVFNRIVAGGELAFYVWPGRVLQLTGRVGFLLTDRVLLYTRAAHGKPLFDTFHVYGLGGGMEIALGQRMSVFGEAGIIGVFNSGCCAFGARAGVNFHLGN